MRIWGLIFLLVGSGVCAETGTNKLSEEAIFRRCYSHLTDTFPPLDHPAIAGLRAGTTKGVDACLSVYDGARLTASGAKAGLLQNDTPEARLVLRTLKDFFSSWFTSTELFPAVPVLGVTTNAYRVHDTDEPALHVLKAAMTPGARFDDIVKADAGIEALRTSGRVPNSFEYPIPQSSPLAYEQRSILGSRDADFPTSFATFKMEETILLNLNLIQHGQLVGVRERNQEADAMVLPGRHPIQGTVLRYPYPTALRGHYGGGILGSSAYILLNHGMEYAKLPDGGLKMPRRYGSAVVSDFFCRTIPVVSPADAAVYVPPPAMRTSQTPSFRLSPQCMRCHTTIDGIASLLRNKSIAAVPWFGGIESDGRGAPAVFHWRADQPRENGLVDHDPMFHRRPSFGSFYYRGTSGTLVNAELGSLAGLGSVIAGQEDFYLCAATRMLSFFTGVQVSMEAFTAGDTSVDGRYKDLLRRMAAKLRQDQSLREAIRLLWQDPLYQDLSLRYRED